MSSKFKESLLRGMKPTPVEEVKKQAKERLRQRIKEKEMTKRHKYADVIVAWAEGKPIQCKQAGIDGAWDKWQDFEYDCKFTPDFDSGDWLWRIKPEHEWDENTTITLKLPTPEHAMVLYAVLGGTNSQEKAEWVSEAFEVPYESFVRGLSAPDGAGYNLFKQVKHLKQPALEAYKEKHNL